MNLKRYPWDEEGFTMIEMMIVLVIIAVLIAGGLKFYSGYIENARITKAKAQISNMQAALEAYYTENGSYPNRDQVSQLVSAGLNPKSGLTDGTLDTVDPWGKNYVYQSDSAGTSGKSTRYYIKTGFDDVYGQKNETTLSCVFGNGKEGVSNYPVVGNPSLP